MDLRKGLKIPDKAKSERNKAYARNQFSSLEEGDLVYCFYPDVTGPPVVRKVLKIDKQCADYESVVNLLLEGIESWLDSFWICL